MSHPLLDAVLLGLDITALQLDRRGKLVRVLGVGQTDPLRLGDCPSQEQLARWVPPAGLGLHPKGLTTLSSTPVRWIGLIQPSSLVSIPVEVSLVPFDEPTLLLLLRPLSVPSRSDLPGWDKGMSISAGAQPLADYADLKWLAFHDPLTGLPGRRLLDTRLRDAIRQARRHQAFVGLVYLDLDRFGIVNERTGHSGGDRLLQELAQDLRGCLRTGDLLARVGGDEFVAVLCDLEAPQTGPAIAERMMKTVQRDLRTPEGPLRITASVGYVRLSPGSSVDRSHLLRAADQAMYQAKALGRNRLQLAQDL